MNALPTMSKDYLNFIREWGSLETVSQSTRSLITRLRDINHQAVLLNVSNVKNTLTHWNAAKTVTTSTAGPCPNPNVAKPEGFSVKASEGKS